MKSTNFHCSAGITLMLATSFAYAFSLFGNDPIDVVKNSFLEDYSNTASIGKVFDTYQYCSNKKWEKFQTQRGEQIVQFSCVRHLENEEIDSYFDEKTKYWLDAFLEVKAKITKVLASASREDWRADVIRDTKNPEKVGRKFDAFYNEITNAVKLNRRIDLDKADMDSYPIASYWDKKKNHYIGIDHNDIKWYNHRFDSCIKYQDFDRKAYYGAYTKVVVQFAFIKNSKKEFKHLGDYAKTVLPNVNLEHTWPSFYDVGLGLFYNEKDIQKKIEYQFWKLLLGKED